MSRFSNFVLRAVVVGLLSVQVSVAQTDQDKSAARAAAKAGIKAYNEQDYEKSLRLFSKAESLVHAPTHLLFMARAHEKQGELVLAQETYRKLIYEQLPDNAADAFVQAQSTAKEELAALEPRIPTITLSLQGKDITDFTLVIDGDERPGLSEVPQPIDPGEHRIQVVAPGASSEEQRVQLSEGENQELTVTMKDTPSTGPKDDQSTKADPVHDSKPAPRNSAGLRKAGWITLSVGAAGMLTGGAMMIASAGNRGRANSLCDGDTCPIGVEDRVTNLDGAANTFRAVGYVGLGVGAGLAGTGIALLILSGKRDQQESAAFSIQMGSVDLTPLISPRGAVLLGRF